MWSDMGMSTHVPCLRKEKSDVTDYMELLMETREFKEGSTDAVKTFLLDNSLPMLTVLNLLWYTVHPSCYELQEFKMKLMYQLK